MIIVSKVQGFAAIQDRGRIGFASQAIPRGGALVRTLYENANRVIGNDDDAACIEVFGRLIIKAESDVRVATDDGEAITLLKNETLTIASTSHRVRYLAIDGGIDAPKIFGSRSAFLGASLRDGDRISHFRSRESASRLRHTFDSLGSIRIIAGPDFPEVAAALTRVPWRVNPASDRKGTRLEGDPIRDRVPAHLPSSPMICGAIELPPSGHPIIIGPDGPTTGGYAVVAVIARADLDRFHAKKLGAPITFVT